MKIEESDYLNSIEPYAFAEVDKARKRAEEEFDGEILDFGVGDPTESTPAVAVAEGIKEAIVHPDNGYPTYEGEFDFRDAVSAWFSARFNVQLDSSHEITATLGSKQAVFALPMAYVNRRDVVLIPDPGYPPYTTGTKQRGGKPVFMPLKEENGFLPSFDEISNEEARKAKMMWINYPNNPTTKIASEDFLKEAVDFCEDNQILLVSDEAYSEMYYDENQKPFSLFNIDGGRDIGLVFHSLSKRSNMTNYRIGFVAGKEDLIKPFKSVQTNLHSGQAQVLQWAAIGALSDETHVEEMRNLYAEKRNALIPALRETGFSKIYSEGTFYLWCKIPNDWSSVDAVKKLLNDKGINATPGGALAQNLEIGRRFLRFALVPSVIKTNKAAERLREDSIFG